MNTYTFITALTWGAITGALTLRLVDTFISMIFCLHGLLISRWKRLSNRTTPGQIKYEIIIQLFAKLSLFGLLFGSLLKMGDNLARWKFHFYYQGDNLLIWGITAAVVATLLARSSWRKLAVSWKITHEFDYAERRKRTSMLKG